MITESPVLTSEKSTTFVTIVGLHRIEKFFPSVNRTLKERYPSSCQCEIQSTFLPCTSGYRRRSFSYFFLIRLSSCLCSAGLIGFIGIPSTITVLGFFFLGMRVLRHGALDARSRCRRTIYFAGGVDSFGFFGHFLRALAPGKKLYQRRFPVQFALTFDAAHQATDFFVGQRFVGKPDVEFLVEVRLVEFFQFAHFEHELKVDHGTTAFETGHGLVVSLHEEFGRFLQALNSPNGFVDTVVYQIQCFIQMCFLHTNLLLHLWLPSPSLSVVNLARQHDLSYASRTRAGRLRIEYCWAATYNGEIPCLWSEHRP